VKIAITSDINLGDSNCLLVGDKLASGPKFGQFREAIGRVDYLVLLGDIFDFSISSYESVYKIARLFLNEILDREIASQIIYIPGNHDFEFWHILEHEVNIIKPILAHRQPRGFRWSMPGVIDDRKDDPREKFNLPDVRPGPPDQLAKYGDVFLSEIAVSGADRLIFNVAYPNLYIVGADGQSAMLTHGHYFEPYWSIIGEWLLKVAGDEIEMADPNRRYLTLDEIVSFNFPLNQLASSGIGQAGELTNLWHRLQRQVKNHELAQIRQYLDRFVHEVIDPQLEYKLKNLDPREWITDVAFALLKKWLLAKLEGFSGARYDQHFLEKNAVRERFSNYYRASLKEIERLANLPADRTAEIPTPQHIIFGHTHQPIGWNNNALTITIDDRQVFLHNTGGWLVTKDKNGKTDFRGAAIFMYDSDSGFRSVPIE